VNEGIIMTEEQRQCAKCGDLFTPRWLSGIQKWSHVCVPCATLNLADFMEEEGENDELADISSGEQVGAWLRDLAKGNRK
jgi:hypothetical protein